MAFPSTALPIKVQLALSADLTADPGTWSWTDLPRLVRLADKISITRGRSDRQSQAEPSDLRLTLDNRDGRFTPRNPSGAYYGQIGRNTPIRVRVDPGSGYVTRYTGYVSEWPPRWDVSGNNRYVRLVANGLLRRLGQGAQALRSALFRAVPDTTPVAYWPLEDGSAATQASTGLSGGSPMAATGTVRFASDSTLSTSAALPDFSQGGKLSGPVAFGFSTSRTVSFVVKCPTGSGAAWTMLRLSTNDTLYRTYEVRVRATGEVDLIGISVIDTTLATVTPSGTFAGTWLLVTVKITGTTTYSLTVRSATGSGTDSSTAGGNTLGPVTGVEINPGLSTAAGSVGHLVVYSGSATELADPFLGYAGEEASDRITRLCGEEGVPVTVTAGDSTLMGPQTLATFLDLVRECEEADGGTLYETVDGKLGYFPRTARYNAAVDLALNHAQQHLAPPFEPTDDDRNTVNDATVSRRNGSWKQFTDDDHIAANGRYPTSVTINVEDDDVLIEHAAWLVHLGTADELRYPRVRLNFARTPSLITSWLGCDLVSRVTISNPPTGLPPNLIDLFVEGYTETLGPREWTVEANCSPATPWDIATVESTARVDSSSATLNATVTTTATSWSVATVNNLWTTTATFPADFPFDLDVEGERVRVTAISGTSSPQTFTVTRSVNGVVKTHALGVPVRLWTPTVVGL